MSLIKQNEIVKKSEMDFGVLDMFAFLKFCMHLFLWLYQISLRNPYLNRAVLNENAGNEDGTLLKAFLKTSGRRS